MQNAPGSEPKGTERHNTFNNILPQLSAQKQYSLPALPPHLERLTSEPWAKETSLQLDWWLWYCQQEFGIAGGAA
jgi:hypothetical protein